jgi:hypothetical protein
VVLLPLSCSCGELYLFVSWCAGVRCGMTGSNDDHDRSRRSGAEDRGWSSIGQVLSGRMIRRSGDAVFCLHCARGDECGFLG